MGTGMGRAEGFMGSFFDLYLYIYEICLLVPLVSLCRASQVSRIWCHMASDYRLWMKLCRCIRAVRVVNC